MKFYSILEGSTQDVLRRFLREIRNIEARIGTAETDVGALKTAVGDEETAGTILARIKALEDAQNTSETPGEGE